MRHYGAPTRLLDFTYSPYIAAYFALEHTDFDKQKKGSETFEVFAVNAIWARDESARINGCDPNENFFKNLIGNGDLDRREFKRYFIDNKSKEFACPFNPFRLTERISIQSGVFMCPGNVNKTFEENLTNLKGWKNNTIKLVLKLQHREIVKVREILYDFNITRATLFPGLEGFAKSLSIYPPKTLDSKKL